MTHLLRTLLTWLGLAAVGAVPLSMAAGLSGPELLDRARKVANLKHGTDQFQAHLEFKLFGISSVPVPGRMEYAWRPSGQWRRELSIPNYFREIDNSGDQVVYKDRSGDYEPLRVGQMYELFSIATNPQAIKDFNWGKVRNSSSADCATAKRGQFEQKWCFDPANGTLTSMELETSRTEFGEFTKIGDRVLPTTLRYYYKKKLAVEAKVTWDFEHAAADELFKPSAGAVDWPACEDMVNPTEDKTPDPQYPRLQPGVTGDDADVGLYVTIAADGKLRMPYVIESAGPVFDRAAAIAIRDWTFHPATCSGKPVPVQGRVEVYFRYGRGGPVIPLYR